MGGTGPRGHGGLGHRAMGWVLVMVLVLGGGCGRQRRPPKKFKFIQMRSIGIIELICGLLLVAGSS